MVGVEIVPAHASADGCSVTSELYREETAPGGFHRGYTLTAKPRGLWAFDHFEISSRGRTTQADTETESWDGTFENDANPLTGWGFNYRTPEEWLIDEPEAQIPYHSQNEVLRIVAVFRILKFDYILCGRDGQILCDRYGRIMYGG